MPFKYLIISLLFLFSCLTFHSTAQEIPPVSRYSPAQYKAGNQNWMIDQDENGWMYFANNDGLLTYNGAQWSTYSSPNNSIMRSVKVIEDRIFTGCYMEFGYWERQSDGQLLYTSLSDSYRDKLIEDEQFWNIAVQEDFILFQSLNRILSYNTKDQSIQSVTEGFSITKMIKIDNDIFFHALGEGLMKLEQGRATPVISDPVIRNSRIAQIIKRGNTLLVLTQQNGIYTWDRVNGIKKVIIPEVGSDPGIYSAKKLENGMIALGTIAQGTFLLNNDLEVSLHLDQSTGLSNNTVLSLFEDERGNLWTAMDNGINCINLPAPFKRYIEPNGKLGTVYTSIKVDNILYLGTNQGLFYLRDGENSFQLIEGTKSQVWALFYYDNTLFCGHDSGSFIIKGTRALKISQVSGTWDFRSVPGQPNRIIQGNYNGFHLLEKTNNNWKYSRPIAGFNISSKHFEITDDLKIFMSHEYKGLFKLDLDSALRKVIHTEKLSQPEKGKNAGLTKFDHDIYYANKDGIYKFCPDAANGFEKSELLSALFKNDQYVSGKMVNDRFGRLWLFTRENLIQISDGALTDSPQIKKIPIPYEEIRAISGYEHINALDQNQYLIASKDGYVLFNTALTDADEYNIKLTEVVRSTRDQTQSYGMHLDTPAPLPFKNNQISFSYAIPGYKKYADNQYQYMLSGIHKEFSPWSTRPNIKFENLPFGDYTFKVRGKIGNKITENVVEYPFQILPPWYFSKIAIACYLLLLIVLGSLINQQYKRHYRSKQEGLLKKAEEKHRLEQLEKEQELTKLRNEKLRQDVNSKSRELAASTMNIIKKNEFLIEIRDNLKNLNGNPEKKVRSIITSINKDIDEEDNWNLFKDAFNNADKDFLKKVKDRHPNLTSNDLRLCAYLRLNLSSKEIAPLLNISARSVEIKRYRLRKKMDLAHEERLTEYILSI